MSASTTSYHFRLAVVLITSLFFMWGLSYGLLDVLNKHFQELLRLSKQESSYLQLVYFGAYFVMALPAGWLMNRVGYKNGILIGLSLFATGAALFYPAASVMNFNFFLFSLFVLACGLAFLETAANPFITVLGDEKSSAFRLNLAQSFNGVGSFIGPIIGGAVLFNGTADSTDPGSLQLVYVAIAILVIALAIAIYLTKMPEPALTTTTGSFKIVALFRNVSFTAAVAAQFFYVAAQVGVAAFFINYCTESKMGDNETAAYLLSLSMVLFTLGRFVGTALLRRFEAGRLLTLYAFINVLLSIVVMTVGASAGLMALMTIFFFESIMFPTIFALGIRGMGDQTKIASSVMVMAIVGGALVPIFMGWVADMYGTAISYGVPMSCFLVVAVYGRYVKRLPS